MLVSNQTSELVRMEKKIKATIVVVDDDSMMREMLKLMLRGEDYSVVGEASNGQDAIAQCEKFKPVMVLLDINMPKMDGLQALEEIRKVSPESIVLMVSADATMDKVGEAIKKGAAGFVVKPLKAASVLDRIAMILKEKKK
jgi:two-component system, chemotaxis family, chemotaxis protein CheY